MFRARFAKSLICRSDELPLVIRLARRERAVCGGNDVALDEITGRLADKRVPKELRREKIRPVNPWRTGGGKLHQLVVAQHLRVGVDHAAITRHLKQLETQGLITRERCLQDNRVIFVDLTDDGRERIAHWTEQKKCLSNRLFVNMKVEDQHRLLDHLNTLQTNIQK